MSESRGTLTGKYAAKDKITSSAVDLLGEESITRLFTFQILQTLIGLIYGGEP